MSYNMKKHIILLSLTVLISSSLPISSFSKPTDQGSKTNNNSKTTISKNIFVKRAYSLYKDNNKYFKGCSEFVSNVLGISWRNADALMGANPISIGTMPNYEFNKLSPGDVVGWKAVDSDNGSAHVAIYTGDINCNFIDVKGRGYTPRKIQGYGKQKVYKSSAY